MTEHKKIICLDFDGVIHSYTSGWKGADVIPDPPIDGALDFICSALRNGYAVSVFSSRSHQEGGIGAMYSWLFDHMVQHCFTEDEAAAIMGAIDFPNHKPPAHISIDDRAFEFRGRWPSLNRIEEFKPWNRKERPSAPEPSGYGEAEALNGI